VVGKRRDLDVDGSEVSASVSIGARPDGGFGLAVELDVHVPALDQATAESVVADAHQVCPYSNATRGNIEVALTVV
jgi:Ohr subfamily peroxiredoxin